MTNAENAVVSSGENTEEDIINKTTLAKPAKGDTVCENMASRKEIADRRAAGSNEERIAKGTRERAYLTTALTEMIASLANVYLRYVDNENVK
ncbi:hypothetical protein EAI_08928 [Harpegnathos saltator]|uniref:Uncharacterized protein n=1 Tax=Harpegnathos saltator TaxID=610380 RepID=E2BYH5_HARSA|nr:hypothetical protein EAI_08928 [Harpegnathos saltator]